MVKISMFDEDESAQKILHKTYVRITIFKSLRTSGCKYIQQDSKQMTSEHDTLFSVTSSYVMI